MNDDDDDDLHAWKARLLMRLGVVVDEGFSYQVRLSAVRAIQAMLDADNPLRRESADDLLDRVLRPWDKRIYLVAGRGVERQVTRPPAGLRDVWK